MFARLSNLANMFATLCSSFDFNTKTLPRVTIEDTSGKSMSFYIRQLMEIVYLAPRLATENPLKSPGFGLAFQNYNTFSRCKESFNSANSTQRTLTHQLNAIANTL